MGENAKYFRTFNFPLAETIPNIMADKCEKISRINESELMNMLSVQNVNFVLSGINRLQSMLICELGLSYVQQSQRYVPVNSESVHISSETSSKLVKDANTLIGSSIALYNKMTELKDPNNTSKRKLTPDDFVHGITYEDARYILPVCLTTNMSVSCTADKLFNLYALFKNYRIIFNDVYHDFINVIPKFLYEAFARIYNNKTYIQGNSIREYNKALMAKLSKDNIVCISTGNPITQVAIGALSSQNVESPDDVYMNWDKDNVDSKSISLISRVISYGHTSILEQARTTFAMKSSMCAYHQIIRHRLQNIQRISLDDILLKSDVKNYILPKSITSNHTFNAECKNLISAYYNFYHSRTCSYANEYIMQFMLNCAPVKFIVSSNIRNDNWIFRERLCFTAQEEIRKLYFKKFKILDKEYHELIKYGLPPCVLGDGCKEGKCSCGRIAEVNKAYSKFVY